MTRNNLAVLPRREQSPTRAISRRESEVLDLLHLRNADIALALGISPWTVKAHLVRIFAVLGVETRAEAVRVWMGRADVRGLAA